MTQFVLGVGIAAPAYVLGSCVQRWIERRARRSADTLIAILKTDAARWAEHARAADQRTSDALQSAASYTDAKVEFNADTAQAFHARLKPR